MTCQLCKIRLILTEMIQRIEDEIPYFNSSLYDDEITEVYNAIDNARTIFECDCEIPDP
jgi:hypothetical protein